MPMYCYADNVTLSSAAWTVASLSVSSADVASSSSRIFGSRTRARAIAMRCFCPPLSCAPRSPTNVSYFYIVTHSVHSSATPQHTAVVLVITRKCGIANALQLQAARHSAILGCFWPILYCACAQSACRAA